MPVPCLHRCDHLARSQKTLRSCSRHDSDSSRIPDVVVCSEALWSQCCAREGVGILDFGEVPNLVVEVTSENWREDYIRKRAEYAWIGIPEYWIIDPNKEQVWILSNPEGQLGYAHVEYTREQSFSSVQFSELVLSVDTVLWPPLVEHLIREEQEHLRQVEHQRNEERQRADRALRSGGVVTRGAGSHARTRTGRAGKRTGPAGKRTGPAVGC
ncbi:MAG: Uma2 family endonuclease [Hormoscilla sp. GUM202]|nr:Uma2 family endonuclease [Hormoscilla sp. GM7CHS1pb]MBO1351759.1 Uma2 family endonuclease [Hormoscilla sp. GUM202]